MSAKVCSPSPRSDTSSIEHLSWDEVEAKLKGGAAALVPVGAAAKEHGLHLPMNSDEVQARWLSRELACRFDLLIWPPLTYGHYPAFADYPGSMSLSEPVFRALVLEVGSGILKWRPRRLFILDTGLSTITPVNAAIAVLGNEALHLKIHAGARYREVRSSLGSQRYGTHADEMETSILLAIAPELVRMERAVASPQGSEAPGPLQRSAADRPSFSASGSYGDPTLATAAKGHLLLAAILEDLDRGDHSGGCS